MSRFMVVACCLALTGCHLGPSSLSHSRTKYNRVLQETAREELLLNLVRLRYHDSHEFIRVASITQQYQYSAGAGQSAGWNGMGIPTGIGQSLGIDAQSKPTFSYTPEQEKEFNRRLLSPIGSETLNLLTSKGWAADRVLQLSVRTINDIDNARSAGGPTPESKPEFERFVAVVNLLRELQKRNGIEVAHAKLQTDDAVSTGQVVPVGAVDGEDLVAAKDKGLEFRLVEDGRAMELWKSSISSDVLVLRVAPTEIDSPEWAEVCSILELERGTTLFRLKDDRRGQLERPHGSRATLRSVIVQGPEGFVLPPPNELSGSEERTELVVSTRSLLEMMYYLSHGIEAPCQHVEKGWVTTTFDECGEYFDWNELTGDLLRVHCCKVCPKDTAVAVQHEGHWFYIEKSDRNSQNTFNLLLELFNLEIRAGGGATAIPTVISI